MVFFLKQAQYIVYLAAARLKLAFVVLSMKQLRCVVGQGTGFMLDFRAPLIALISVVFTILTAHESSSSEILSASS